MLDERLLAALEKSARRLGFARMAALPVTPVAGEFLRFHHKLTGEQLPKDLLYLRRPQRENPQALLPGARTMLIFLYPYRFRSVENKLRKSAFKIARYAWQRDYHKLLRDKLHQLLQEFSLTGRAITDSAPFPERYWARRAGLGKIGRNGLLIHEELGSYFFIATLLVEQPMAIEKSGNMASPAEDISLICGECQLCVTACPTGALNGDSTMDVRRCLSFITVESREELPDFFTRKNHRWIFGCDICQQVCPWNRKFFADDNFSAEHPQAERIAGGKLPLSRRQLRDSVFHRRGWKRLSATLAAVRRG
ncbi:MAG: DUF1730 domain-containing protein [Leptospiraceae bacterium]|nr:DUF1730 domain-containing protein [Leptospiraceae bacterium]